MADTPLHEHEAVKHLMGTEHWPTGLENRVAGFEGRIWWHRSGCAFGSSIHVSDDIAESLITLAAVRGIMAKGWTPHFYSDTELTLFRIGPECEGDDVQILDTLGFVGPLAVLEAYAAVCCNKENSNA